MKKLLAMLLCLAMLATGVFVLAACNNNKGDDKTYDIKVWVGEYTDELTRKQIAKFNETNEWGVTFNATVEVVSEKVAVGDASAKAESAADLFCFVQDNLARAVRVNLLAPLNNASLTDIEQNHTESAVEAAKIGGTIRAFPMTSDNAFFMYYDKSVITDATHLTSLEALLADCEAANKTFAMDLSSAGGSAWYAESFFYATGCKSDWTTGNDGSFTAYDDTFNSANGEIALKGIKKVVSSKAYLESCDAGALSRGSAVVISGIWDYTVAKDILKDNLGVAALPSFTVDGTSYQLVSNFGHKFMGIKPQSDSYKALYLQKLAMYLTSAECQLERFNTVAWIPTIKSLQDNADVKASPCLAAIQNTKLVLQGQYPSNWWSVMATMVGKVRGSEETGFGDLLADYAKELPSLKVSAD